MLLNCGVGVDSWSPLDCKEIQPVHPKGNQSWIHWRDWCWGWSYNPLATWCEEPTHWKRPWCWERLKLGEGDDRGWDGWMASLTQWTWVWASSGQWWRTGKPDMLPSMGSQRVTQLCNRTVITTLPTKAIFPVWLKLGIFLPFQCIKILLQEYYLHFNISPP